VSESAFTARGHGVHSAFEASITKLNQNGFFDDFPITNGGHRDRLGRLSLSRGQPTSALSRRFHDPELLLPGRRTTSHPSRSNRCIGSREPVRQPLLGDAGPTAPCCDDHLERSLVHLRGGVVHRSSCRLGLVCLCMDELTRPKVDGECRMEARRVDRETAESAVGVTRLLRRAATLVWVPRRSGGSAVAGTDGRTGLARGG
jgi:hypothetical protein